MSRKQTKRVKMGANVRPEMVLDGDNLEELITAQKQEPAPEPESDEKDYGEAMYMPTYNANSFAELDMAREAAEKARMSARTVDDFQALLNNIMWSDEIKDKGVAIKKLADEFVVRLDMVQRKEEKISPVQFVKNILGLNKPVDGVPIGYGENRGSLMVTKDSAGQWRWLGIFTNNYKDTDGEILTAEAHKEFCRYLDEHPEYAPLSVSWHTLPTARKSQADFWDYTDDGFFVMGGSLTEDEAAVLQKAQETYELGMSHGFFVLEKDEKKKLITKYRTFEVSDLPVESAANKWTNFSAMLKEANMFSDKKRTYLVGLYGETAVKQMEAEMDSAKKALEAAGIESKEVKETVPDPAPVEPAAEAKTETAPVDPPAADPDTGTAPQDKKDEAAPVEPTEPVAPPAESAPAAAAPEAAKEPTLADLMLAINRFTKEAQEAKQIAQEAKEAATLANKSVEDRWAEAILPPIAVSMANVKSSEQASQSDATKIDESDPLFKQAPKADWITSTAILGQ